jgi:DUF1680 family protein
VANAFISTLNHWNFPAFSLRILKTIDMNRKLITCTILLLAACCHIAAQSYVPEKKNKMQVADAVAIKAFAVPVDKVSLLDGPFKKAMEADAAYLLKIEPDRLLSDFRAHAGLKPKAERYGGWESSGLAGHTLGHYLSACALQYTSTNDTRFLDKVNYVVEELALCQPARSGYLGAIPKEDSIWAEVQKGNIRSRGFDLNGAWSPWYTVHKVMAGLLDAYLYCHNNKALDLQIRFADWTENLLKDLADEQIQKMLLCEYGGMNEALVNTYALTKDKRYLALSYKFHDKRVLDSLALGKDVLPGKHSNTQIPKLIGSIRRYELTGNADDKTRAEFFWNTVVQHHSYAAGGNSNYEYFGPADQLSETLTDNTMETCNTYNMLKLTRHLFALDPNASYFDYYENGLYNHILSSQNHDDGMMCYFVPLRMGGRKRYSNPFNTFTCCVGSGMENHVKYGEAIYAAGSDGSLYVNLFIASQLSWADNNRQLKMETSLPESNKVLITFTNDNPVSYTLKLRKPKWAGGAILILVNGKQENTRADENGYFSIKRRWKKDDQVELQFPLSIYAVSMPDNKNRQAFFYGPVLLAGDLGTAEPDPVKGIPVVVSGNNDPSQWIQRDASNLQFGSLKVGQPQDISFRPFNQVKDQYYSVYFDVFSQEGWKNQQAKYETEKLRLQEVERLTVDVLRMGEMQPERDHEFTGETFTGEGHGKKWRLTRQAGSMIFNLKVAGDKENELQLTYWGMDNRGRIFEIWVDGKQVATEDLNKYKKSEFYEIRYSIPSSLTNGKEKVTITLKAGAGNSVGPVYGNVRMMIK